MAKPLSNAKYDKWREKYGVVAPKTTTKTNTTTNTTGKSSSTKGGGAKTEYVGNPATSMTKAEADMRSGSASLSKNTGKKYTDVNSESKKTYTRYKDRVNTPTTITGDMSESERRSRISEIDSELRNLNSRMSGYSRAKKYGTNKYMEAAEQKDRDRIAELTLEKTALERVGTFTASEMKQFEIEDAKTRRLEATRKASSYGSRPSVDEAEGWREAQTEVYKAQRDINELERHKTFYDDIAKFGDVVNEDDFFGQWRANYRLTELHEDGAMARSIYMDNPTPENRDIALAYKAFVEEYAKNNEKALDDKGRVLPLLSDNFASHLAQQKGTIGTAVPLGILGAGIGLLGGAAGAKAGWTTGYSIGAGIHSYDVIRGSLYNELLSYGLDDETARKYAEDDAVVEALIESGETAKDWLFMLYGGIFGKAGSAAVKETEKAAKLAAKYGAHPIRNLAIDIAKGTGLNAVSEYVEEGLQGAVSRGTRERAWATLDAEIGRYGEGNIDLHNRPIYINDDGTISTVDSAIYLIDGVYVLLPTVVRGENGEAKRLATDEEVVEHYEKTGEYLGEFNTLEEANGYANSLHYAQQYRYSDNTSTEADDNAIIGGAKVLGDAVFGGNREAFEELHEQGKEGFKTGIVSGGVQGVARFALSAFRNARTIEELNKIADIIKDDEEALDALIEEGKASGKGTVSAKIAEEVEQAKDNGKVSRDQVKSLMASNEVYINEEEQRATVQKPKSEKTEVREAEVPEGIKALEQAAMEVAEKNTQENHTVTVAEAKKATAFGDAGSVLVAEVANNNNISIEQAERVVGSAYRAGFTGLKSNQVTFASDTQRLAFQAGRDDRQVQNRARAELAKKASVYETGFTENEYSAKLTENEREFFSILAKDMKMDIKFVDKIIADRVTGKEANASHEDGKIKEANASHEDGEMRISNEAELEMIAIGLHETLHRMRQLDPEGTDALMNMLYDGVDQNERRMKLGDPTVSMYEVRRAEMGDGYDTIDYIEDIAAESIQNLFVSPEKFIEWRKKLDANPKAKGAWQKLCEAIKEFFADLWDALTHSKMELEAKKEKQAEVERVMNLFTEAYKGAMEKAEERASEKKFGSDTNEETEGNKKFSLSPTKIERLKSIILDLGKKKIKKVAGEKTIRISTDKFSVNKAIHSKKGRTDREVNARIKAIPEFEAIIRRSTFSHTDTKIVGLEGEAKKGVIAMHYFKTTHNGFDVEVVVRDKGKNQSLYEVKFIENKKSSQQSMPNDIGSSAPNGDVENDISLTQNPKSVKRQFSIKDSEGNTLTEAQQEYFKDSKVRDENGRLLVVYHGTSKGGFTQFDTYAYYSKFGLFGNGAYFTTSKDIAEAYTRKGRGNSPQVYVSYLNITNPIDMDAKADISAWNKAMQKSGEDFRMLDGDLTNEQAFRRMVEDLEYAEVYSYDASEIVRNIFEDMGYDGITHIGGGRARQSDGTRHRVFIAFEPEQAKDKDNKNPTSHPNMHFSLKKADTIKLSAEEQNAVKALGKGTEVITDKNGSMLIADEVKSRAEYQKVQTPKWESTVEQVEKMLLSNHKRNSLKGGTDISSAKGALDAVEALQKGEKGAAERVAKYVDEGMVRTEAYDELIEKYGAIPVGENPSREVQVPQRTAKDKKVSQTVRTVLEAEATPDEMLPTIEKMVEDGVFSYDVYTDKQAISDSEEELNKNGWLESYNNWMSDVEKGIVSKQHTVMGWALYNNAVNTATESTSETERKTATETALSVLDAMVRHQRSAAQALQATRVLKKLSPETQLYAVQKSVQSLQKELDDKYGDKAPELNIDSELAEEFLNAKSPEERVEIEKRIYKDIGRQMPSRFSDMWNAWRYLAMLFNLRTHGRNILGNLNFAPVVVAKNMTASAIEAAVHRVSGKKVLRSKSIIWGNKNDRLLLKAAFGDYKNVADIVSGDGKYNDSAIGSKSIQDGRVIFTHKNRFLRGILKPVEFARVWNGKLLDAEDMWFAKPHYAFALASYCKANNISPDQIERGMAIGPAREYAIKEAKKATYRDTNAFSEMVSDLGRRNKNETNAVKKLASTVVEGILPFRKTPANILVRGVEYSPIGLLKGLSYDLVQLRKGKISAAEAIDNISAGLTGTGLLALGVLLAAQGLIRGHGGEEKDEREFKELMGHQSYALELPNGQSITLDWLAPESLPFFVGVNLWETTQGSDKEVRLADILQAVTHITEPMLEMSCLQSLNDLVENIGYASSNNTSGLVSFVTSALKSYITQIFPTLMGQAERTSEEYRMTTYTDKNAFLTGDMQYTLGKISQKIPFWDYSQIPYVDAWGRKEASGTALKRGWNNFLNPAYTSTIEESDMEKELLRLYEATGDGGVFPSRADKYFTVDKQRKDLTADEYVKYATLKGEKSYELVTDLVKSKSFKSLSDEEKVKAIKEVYDYANQKAKQSVSRYEPEKWVHTADEFGDSAADYISFKTDVSGTKADNGGKISKQEVANIIMDAAQSDEEMWKMYMSMYDSQGDVYAYENGVDGEDYMAFLLALEEYDQPTKSGKYGTYTQAEAQNAINSLDGLTREEKRALFKSVNTSWKKNPY